VRARYFYGWNVVAATFAMAACSFGLGFYGISVYVAALQRLHGWSASAVSAPVTVYYVSGAVLTASIASLFERFGPRPVVAGGGVAMAAGLAALGHVAEPWQLYPAFAERTCACFWAILSEPGVRAGPQGPGSGVFHRCRAVLSRQRREAVRRVRDQEIRELLLRAVARLEGE
jgi:hypothetical protein